MTKSDLRIKLTEDQKKTIAALKGENVSELARYYNVSRRTLSIGVCCRFKSTKLSIY